MINEQNKIHVERNEIKIDQKRLKKKIREKPSEHDQQRKV